MKKISYMILRRINANPKNNILITENIEQRKVIFSNMKMLF